MVSAVVGAEASPGVLFRTDVREPFRSSGPGCVWSPSPSPHEENLDTGG
jgi:hypothetical protein